MMRAILAMWCVALVPASWGAKRGCHPATVLDWNTVLEAANSTDKPYISLNWELASTWGLPAAEESEYRSTTTTTTRNLRSSSTTSKARTTTKTTTTTTNKNGTTTAMTTAASTSTTGTVTSITTATTTAETTTTTTKTKAGRSRRLADTRYWTETGGVCVDIEEKKVARYRNDFGKKSKKIDCRSSCENSRGCEAFSIHLTPDEGTLKPSSCSLYGASVVAPDGFEFVAGSDKSVVQGQFPKATAIYPYRCFVRVPDTPVLGSGPSRTSVVTDAGQPAPEVTVTLVVDNNKKAAASYIQLEHSVLSIHDSIFEVTGTRSLCAPTEGECNLADIGAAPKVLESSTYVSPSDTVVVPRVVQVDCPDVSDRKTMVSCHADGTWHSSVACLSTSTTTRVPTTTKIEVTEPSTTEEQGSINSQGNDLMVLIQGNLVVAIIVITIIAAVLIVLPALAIFICCLRRVRKKMPKSMTHTSVELTEIMDEGGAFWTSEGDTLPAQRDPDNLRQVLYGLKMPPEVRMRPVPLLTRTLETSNYKYLYDTAQRPRDTNTFLSATKYLVRNAAWKQRIPLVDANKFFNKLKVQAACSSDADVWGDLDGAAEMQWTSAKKLNGVEFCSYLNQALREDHVEDMIHTVMICRAITNRIVGRVAKDYIMTTIPEVCWRGGGFDDRFKDFFTVGLLYRVPGFLATSINKCTAERFIRRVPEGKARCLWKIEMDKTCTHAMLLQKSHLKEEKEYLFAPYSVFQINSVVWSTEEGEPHQITIGAAADNRKHSLCLPLVPYY